MASAWRNSTDITYSLDPEVLRVHQPVMCRQGRSGKEFTVHAVGEFVESLIDIIRLVLILRLRFFGFGLFRFRLGFLGLCLFGFGSLFRFLCFRLFFAAALFFGRRRLRFRRKQAGRRAQLSSPGRGAEEEVPCRGGLGPHG